MKKYFAVAISAYTVFLLYMMFFGSGRQASETSYLQIIPFNTIRLFFTDSSIHGTDFLVNIVGNVFVFSPFGCLGLFFRKLNKIIPYTLVFMLVITCVELVQSFTGRGVADIDDVFLNTLGMVIGFTTLQIASYFNLANINEIFGLYEPETELETATA